MHTYLAAAAANCNTGTWSQKWHCGWNQQDTAAYHAGYFAGHNIFPALIVLAVILLAARAVKGARKRRSSPAAPARAGARR